MMSVMYLKCIYHNAGALARNRETPYNILQEREIPERVIGPLKGHLLCKIHFFMSFLHQHVSPLCKEILKVPGKKDLLSFCPDPFI